MELILEKLIPIVGSKGWKTPNIENAKYVHDITNFKNGKPSIILLPKSTQEVINVSRAEMQYNTLSYDLSIDSN